MDTAITHYPPRRITDLVNLKKQGKDVTCSPDFEIYPVDFEHRQAHFQAYVFLCRHNGLVDGQAYSFRKCYARGCPNNLCQHVSKAVMIANRHLQRDYHVLRSAGVEVSEKLFTLENMMVEFDQKQEADSSLNTIFDFINMAQDGKDVKVKAVIEEVPAIEHFDYQKNAQTFIICDFDCSIDSKQYNYQRCLSCYSTDKEAEERPQAVLTANARLENLYAEFDKAGIKYEKKLC
ncbi:Uncharacterized protein dnl_49460 [Desulfonema limicola]|uniref:Uncharacterized protein n=1 Tax=Desulfonema limicola TaxID=45656 RepID=A0A975BC71_9BACT|nr:hypothetical protein [Desulfonema limicola]QTA82569.1 Uncharacterized protein dnl_49460 [Desulfonema limicola]